MTVGPSSAKKRNEPSVVRCQKCLEYGHWTYECKGKRKIVLRESRTAQLNKRLKLTMELSSLSKNNSDIENVIRSESTLNRASSSSSSSSTSSSSDSDSDSSDTEAVGMNDSNDNNNDSSSSSSSSSSDSSSSLSSSDSDSSTDSSDSDED